MQLDATNLEGGPILVVLEALAVLACFAALGRALALRP
jgi:hypothetical protein